MAGGRILVVDDDVEYLERVADMLKVTFGASKVHTATNGELGMRAFRTYPDIDLVITDLHMPKMGGDQLIDKVLACNADQQCIIISSQPEELGRLTLASTCRILAKPFRIGALLALIDQMRPTDVATA